MTPLQIEIVMHYYCRADDYRDGDFSAPAVRDAIDWLREDAKLIAHNEGDRKNMYRVTQRGLAYVQALQNLPLPVQTWVMPSDCCKGLAPHRECRCYTESFP